jgi:hypothetical protein
MFTHAVDLTFASPETPAALQEAFAELREAVRPLAGDDNLTSSPSQKRGIPTQVG